MDDRFLVCDAYICPANFTEGKNFKLNLSYPTRACIVDTKQEIAIDINTRLKYNYVETINESYVNLKVCKKLINGQRIAIFPTISLGLSKYNYNDIIEIIKGLKKGKEFEDGNKVFNNEEYLKYISEEKLELNNKEKIKMFRKR